MERITLDIIDDYLSDRLSEADLEAFEEKLLDDVELQQQVRVQMAFRDGLRAESDLLLAESPVSVMDRLTEWVVTPAWSYTASAAVVLMVGVLLIGTSSDTGEFIPTAIVPVENLRSGELVKAPSLKPFVLSIGAYGIESATLSIDRPGQTPVVLPGLTADDNQLINVIVQPLEPGAYNCELKPNVGEPSNFTLTVE